MHSFNLKFLKSKLIIVLKNIRKLLIQILQSKQMKHSPSIGPNDTQNPFQLRHKINAFKQHLLNLHKTYTKSRSSSVQLSDAYSHTFHPFLKPNDLNHQIVKSPSNLFNRYQKQNLNRITKENVLLLSRMMKIDKNHSKYNDTAFNSTFIKLRNNFMISKIHDRQRSLTQISKENKSLNKKIMRCTSSDKKSVCSQWKKDWGNRQKQYSENLSRKLPKISHDYRALAYDQLRKQAKPFNRLRLKL